MGVTRLERLRLAVDETRLALLREGTALLAAAGAIFVLSYADGGYASTTRAYAAIAAWWLLGVGAALGLGGARSQVSRLAIAATSLFGLFALWILASISWSSDAERAFAQFDQVSLYVAVLVLGIVVARLVPASALLGGVALALTAVAVVALVSRLFPSSFATSTAPASQFLSTLDVRLWFPLGYWNGLGIDVALALPPLLATMSSRRHPLARAVAALPLPVIAAVMYLTSSRGAFAAAAVAVVAYLLLSANRWSALAAIVVAGASGAAAVAFMLPRKALVNPTPGTTALGIHQGHQTAVAIALIALGTAVLWFVVGLLGKRVPSVPRVVGWVTTGVLVALGAAAFVAVHPIRRFEQFKSRPNLTGSSDFVTSHLLSSSGSGRWQLWGSAVSEFRAHPLNGGGAGSFLPWWLQHQPYYFYTAFAHSLYLETLGELGVIGILLLAGALAVAVFGAVRASLVLRSSDVAAATACAIAFFAAAAYDWVWQLSGIAVVGVGLLGVALGTLPSGRASAWGRFGVLRPLLALLAVAAIVPQVVVLAAGLHLRDSQAAFNSADLGRAKSQALAAKTIEPWASGPYLQLAQIEESEAHFGTADSWIQSAIRRSPNDYYAWYVAAQIDTRRGRILQAVRDLDQVRRLYPLSGLLQAGG